MKVGRKAHYNCGKHSNLSQENYVIQLIQQYSLTGSLKINKTVHSETYPSDFFSNKYPCCVLMFFNLDICVELYTCYGNGNGSLQKKAFWS